MQLLRKSGAVLTLLATPGLVAWAAHDSRRLTRLESRIDAEVITIQLDAQRACIAHCGPQAEDRILDLPEDGDTWHTILFLRPDWRSNSAERRAHTIFFTEAGLSSLRQQTHWHVITTDQPEFQAFRSLVTVTPCLLVERANGEVIYRESGLQLGQNNDGLRRAIRREVERHCPDGRCLPLHPVPGPAPDAPDEIPAVLREGPAATDEKRNPLVALFAALAGLAGGAAANWKRNG
ncbi:MAG: hypothetical protein ACT4QC_17735 [Planctomycetaceae bacterium]